MLKKWLILLLLPALFLTSCRDAKDPEDREYIITLGVDWAEAGYRFTFAPAHPDETESAPYIAESRTLAGAVAQVDCSSSRRTELGQLKTIIFGEALLADGERFRALLEELEQSREVSEKVLLLATEEEAAACVAAILQEESGLFLWDFYKNTAQQVAVTKATDLDTFRIEWRERAGCAILPRISPEGERLRLGGGIAIGERGVYRLTDAEERGYLFLLGEAEGACIEGEGASCRILKSDARITFSEKGDAILCRIFLPLEGEWEGDGAEFAARIKAEVLHTIELAAQTGEDMLGILPRLSRSAPALAEGKSREALLAALEYEILPQLERKSGGLV